MARTPQREDIVISDIEALPLVAQIQNLHKWDILTSAQAAKARNRLQHRVHQWKRQHRVASKESR